MFSLDPSCIVLFSLFKLGAGTALPGLVAAKFGAVVTLSEMATDDLHLLEHLRESCVLNGLKPGVDITVMELTWGIFSTSILELPPQDVVLGSDCFYDTKGMCGLKSYTSLCRA